MKRGCTGWVAGLSAVLTGLLAGCEAKHEDLTQKTVYTGPLVESNNVLMIFSDSAKLQAKLTAPLQQQFESGDMVFPKTLKITFYGDNGARIINTLEGNYGKYDKNQNLFTVRGKVKVRNEEKHQQLNTEELFFNRQKGTIFTAKETAVRVETDTEVLTGFGLEANQEFSRYKIFKPTGIFTVQQPDQK
ncbi:LPS export ABC transporter periplasmic protein LptC [Hymenobacter lutimineralis]|uniref:LPS export ABC transporter periplasmic protein LptC n=1 Tax=Hymenobacter lutimineralis TaxID=2606448 RepID=A0A5D6V996_9BACT|nr:LPS export ABC transporter periplasmic protein LptC [Hymenobacter lutimineralis]TYZ11468.1 LPS export ABC transporter periplasmic protein LptC [Hymenobacter lutimineralis]